ncbi:MAG: diaminopimelate decarboxylase [Ignavibacteriae bacterium HGW-Ignavibacteriae-4]|jgi:diaminopimelate decarboxylase|nr:MAG: diaminopimelate decarboxylase [Ignavibacteriae bacterium HGW-Ignavibacteriae-4]
MKKIANVDIKELAKEYGTPLYVYDKEKFQNNYKRLNEAFIKHYENTKIHFSVKANSNINVLKVFNEMGCGADCSSPYEFLYAKKAGFTNDRILYTGNYESPEDLETVAREELMLNLDDITSFKRLQKINTPELVSFRINPGYGRGGFEGITTAGTEAKFGVPYEKAFEAYKLAKDSGVKRFGIHMMTGSNNLEPYFFAEIVDKLMMIAGDIFNELDIIPEYIDIGGGFGIPYNDGEEELNIETTGEKVARVFIENCDKYGFGRPKLILEPGRYLAGNAGYLVTSVTAIKESYKKFVGLDAGMNFLLRPALYGAFHRVRVYGKDDYTEKVNLCGQICENSDIFAKNIMMPIVEEGDLVTFLDAGAYGYVMASNYNNRMRPPEILIDNDKHKQIRRRETVEDIFNLYNEKV